MFNPKNLFKKSKDPKKLFPDTRHVIEHAFTVGGKDYYKFTDSFNIPYERGLFTLLFYKELDANIDNDFLLKHAQAVDKIYTSNPIDIFRAKALNDLLIARAKGPKDPDLLYKVASVVYFDKNENPEVYDWKYCEGKIAHWKEHEELKVFFCRKPLQQLIPYLKYAEEDLETFTRIATDLKKVHSEKVSEVLSAEPKMTLKS